MHENTLFFICHTRGLERGTVGVLLVAMLIILIGTTGCTTQNSDIKDDPTWNLSADGKIQFTLSDPEVYEYISEKNNNLIIKNLTFSESSGNVSAILILPQNPLAFLVWAPGANNPAIGYQEYMEHYAEYGIGVLILDVRGNGGETPGYPMNIQKDAELFVQDQWPEYYLIAIDMIYGEHYLHTHYPDIPIFAAGDSNGGRYASLAAATEPNFSGYIGVSTSGFGRVGEQYSSPLKEFLLSIDPEVEVTRIHPRPIILFHAPADPVIPFHEGESLAQAAGNDTIFISFNGTHGVNREVDEKIINLLTNYLNETTYG